MDEDSGEENGLESITEDLIELDAEEFNLPPVESLPTLESILGEDDSSAATDYKAIASTELPIENQSDMGSFDSMSYHSTDSGSRMTSRHRINPSHNSYIRQLQLRNVTSELISTCERVDAGKHTAMTVGGGGMIAVGTGHGFILVFERTEALKFCLCETETGDTYGAVSSVAINYEGTRLLAGFARGHLQLWDLNKGKLLQTIDDVHQMGTAVLHIRFTDIPGLVLFSDSGGSVFEVRLKQRLGRHNYRSRCLFSGARGEVVTFEPLLVTGFPSHPLEQLVLIAMATMSKVIVVALLPQLRVLFSHALESEPTHVPVLAWQFVVIRVDPDINVIDPVLTFGRKERVHFFQVCIQEDKIQLVPLQWIEFEFTLQALHWFNARTLAILDEQEKLHVWDVRSQEELELCDLSHVKLVYSSSHFKGLSTGGNVSQAMSVVGERACYETFVMAGPQLVLLGTRSVHLLMIRTWLDRIDTLLKRNKHSQALAVAMELYEDKGKGVVGLYGSREHKQLLIKNKIKQVLIDYMGSSIGVSKSTEHYNNVVPLCVQYSMQLNEIDLVFNNCYETFILDPSASSIYFESLEPFILSDQLIDIPPHIVQELVSYYEKSGKTRALEAILVHLNVTSIDINQVMPLCWLHSMYDAILHIYNQGMKDFTTPLEELLTELDTIVKMGKQLTDRQVLLGNKILVYISSCLAGRAYPNGELDMSLIPHVKSSVLNTLTSLHTQDAQDWESAYPYLRTLLRFDTREFLNVLDLAFEEPEFNSELGMRQRQRIINILLEIVMGNTEEVSTDNGPYTATQLGALFTFIARQMALPNNTITVSKDLFDKVLQHLTVPGDNTHHEQRQQALIELLLSGGLDHTDQDTLIELVENAKFYKICEMLYERRGEHGKILDCYLNDDTRIYLCFPFLNRLFCNEPQIAKDLVMKSIETLVDVNPRKTVILFYDHMYESLMDGVHCLDHSDKQLQYKFVKSAVELKDNAETSPPAELFELCVDLFCQIDSTQVIGFLQTTDLYRLDVTLDICRRRQHSDAVAFLLEKRGDIQEAFQVLMNALNSKSTILEGDEVNEATCAMFEAKVLVIIQFCQRTSSKLDVTNREELWFTLLDAVLLLQKRIRQSLGKDSFVSVVQHLISSMMGNVSLPAMLQRLLTNPAYNGGRFGDIRKMLMDIIDAYQYEAILLEATARVIHRDTHATATHLRNIGRRGFGVYDYCRVCRLEFVDGGGNVVVFRCGHSLHVNCARTSDDTDLQCRLCSQAAMEKEDEDKEATKEEDASNVGN